MCIIPTFAQHLSHRKAITHSLFEKNRIHFFVPILSVVFGLHLFLYVVFSYATPVAAQGITSSSRAPSAATASLFAPISQSNILTNSIAVSRVISSSQLMDSAVGQSTIARQRAADLQTAIRDGDFTEARQHTEHIINILDGASGDLFGDANSDGQIQNAGDGKGVRVYLDEISIQIASAATDQELDLPLDKTSAITQTLAESGRLTIEALDTAREIFSAPTVGDMQTPADQLAQRVNDLHEQSRAVKARIDLLLPILNESEDVAIADVDEAVAETDAEQAPTFDPAAAQDSIQNLATAAQETALAAERATVLQNSLANLAPSQIQNNAEEIINILDGEQGYFYGDIDRNGEIRNPGDGTGVRTYLSRVQSFTTDGLDETVSSWMLANATRDGQEAVDEAIIAALKLFSANNTIDMQTDSDALSDSVAAIADEIRLAQNSISTLTGEPVRTSIESSSTSESESPADIRAETDSALRVESTASDTTTSAAQFSNRIEQSSPPIEESETETNPDNTTSVIDESKPAAGQVDEQSEPDSSQETATTQETSTTSDRNEADGNRDNSVTQAELPPASTSDASSNLATTTIQPAQSKPVNGIQIPNTDIILSSNTILGIFSAMLMLLLTLLFINIRRRQQTAHPVHPALLTTSDNGLPQTARVEYNYIRTQGSLNQSSLNQSSPNQSNLKAPTLQSIRVQTPDSMTHQSVQSAQPIQPTQSQPTRSQPARSQPPTSTPNPVTHHPVPNETSNDEQKVEQKAEREAADTPDTDLRPASLLFRPENFTPKEGGSQATELQSTPHQSPETDPESPAQKAKPTAPPTPDEQKAESALPTHLAGESAVFAAAFQADTEAEADIEADVEASEQSLDPQQAEATDAPATDEPATDLRPASLLPRPENFTLKGSKSQATKSRSTSPQSPTTATEPSVQNAETALPIPPAGESALYATALQTEGEAIRRLGQLVRITAEQDLPYSIPLYISWAVDGTPKPIQIGRNGEANTIAIRSMDISRQHATIEQKEGAIYLRDNQSSTGTYLNGRQLDAGEEVTISNEDLIGFGNVRYKFREEII